MGNTASANILMLLERRLTQYCKHVHPDENDPTRVFLFYTADHILQDHDLSPSQINFGLTDGPNDGGVDGFYMFINERLVQEEDDYQNVENDAKIDLIIFQSTTKKGFEESAIEHLSSVSTDIFDLPENELSSGVYNNQLTEAIRCFHDLCRNTSAQFLELSVSFIYASKGTTPAPGVQRKVKDLETKVKKFSPDAVFDFKFLGIDKLYRLAIKQKHDARKLHLAETPISPDGHEVGYVCLVELSDFFDFITEDKKILLKQLFDATVRDSQGHVEVNNEIRASLKDDAEDFWWLNNGISILSTKVQQVGKNLTIQDPQIVNGLQTSREIYRHYMEQDIADTDRRILVRVMVTTEEASRDRIIKATNSQNKIPTASLRATDQIHRLIEEHWKDKGLYYDRRKNHYKNEGMPRSKIMGISDLAQAVTAIVLREPNQARGRPSSLLKKDFDYKRIFSSEYPLDLYHICAEGIQKVESILKSLNIDRSTRGNIKYYVAMHAIAGVGRQKPAPDQITKFDLSSLNEETIKRSLEYILPKYEKHGGDLKASKGPNLLNDVLSTQ